MIRVTDKPQALYQFITNVPLCAYCVTYDKGAEKILIESFIFHLYTFADNQQS